MSGIDEYVKLLIHSNTSDGSTSFTDSGAGANCPHSITAYGDVHHETDQAKFGTTSIKFDGTGDYLSLANDSDWGLGTGNFTLDCWVYVTAIPAVSRFFARGNILGNNGAWSWGFGTTWGGGTKMNFAYRESSTIRDHTSAAITVSTSAWHHFAIVRNGSNLLFFFDGSLISTVAIVGSGDILTSNTDPLYVGCRAAGAAELMNGFLDELRLSKGAARWTATFTPPTEAYSTAVSLSVGNVIVRALAKAIAAFQWDISGIVQEGGSPVARTVRVYKRSDGSLVDSIVSDDEDGSFSFEDVDPEQHFVIAFDDADGEDYNAVIYDKIAPKQVI